MIHNVRYLFCGGVGLPWLEIAKFDFVLFIGLLILCTLGMSSAELSIFLLMSVIDKERSLISGSVTKAVLDMDNPTLPEIKDLSLLITDIKDNCPCRELL